MANKHKNVIPHQLSENINQNSVRFHHEKHRGFQEKQSNLLDTDLSSDPALIQLHHSGYLLKGHQGDMSQRFLHINIYATPLPTAKQGTTRVSNIRADEEKVEEE